MASMKQEMKQEINREISGEQFNDLFKKHTFVKILSDNLTHNGFTYKQGLNIDTNDFNPNGECQSGGLYFCDIWLSYLYLRFGNKFAYVIVPDDARVYIEENKFKSDKLILNEIFSLTNLHLFSDNNFIRLAIRQNGCALQYIKEQTEEICKLAVQQHGSALQFVKKQTEEICKLAVQRDSRALQFVKKQTEEICKLAVQQNVCASQYVKLHFK